MVPGIYLRRSVKHMLRPVQCGSKIGPGPVELEMWLNSWWVIIWMCCRLFDHEIRHFSLPQCSFDSCLFYGVPVVRVFVLLSLCLHWCWFVLFQTSVSCLRRCRNSLHLWNKIKNNYCTGRVGVYKQIVSLYVIDN